MKEVDCFYAPDIKAWREWLMLHHESADAIWLVMHKKSSGLPTISWSEAVDVALCFGWIDSKKIKINETTGHQFFCKRKAKSTWSAINKRKVEVLQTKGLMMPAGLRVIEIAKKNGSWDSLNDIDNLIIPPDLSSLLAKSDSLKLSYDLLSNSRKKLMLYNLMIAKRPETRQKRLNEIVNELEAASLKK